MSPRELPPIDARVLPFRRPSASVRVRRRTLWATLGRPFLQALGMVGLPFAVVAWGLTAPSFALSSVEVAGNRFVETSWVERRVAPFAGENLLRLSLAEVRSRVTTHPWVASVTLEKRLPNRLRLTLDERRPAGLLRSGDELVYLDLQGRVIAPFEPGPGTADLLLVSIGATREVELAGAFAIADELALAAPDWGASLSEVVVLGEGDFRLFVGALPFPLLVRSGTLAERLPAMRALLPELERRYPRLAAVDLRAQRRIVFQPVVERS